MDKRSPRSPAIFPKSPLVYEKYKSGCAWGLIGLFGFRQGHSNRKLVSDKRHIKSHSVDNKYRRNKLNLLSEFDDKCQCIDKVVDKKNVRVNSGIAEVKQITGEEMSCKQQITKKVPTAKLQRVQSNSELVDRLQKKQRRSKNSKKPCYIPLHSCNNVSSVGHRQPLHQNLFDRSSKKFNTTTTTTTEAFYNQVHVKNWKDKSARSISHTKHEQLTEINLQVHMNEAAEVFINQKFTDGKCLSRGGSSNQPKNFLAALEILNSNRELFIKLLQDPNSLLVKHIQDLRDSQANNPQAKSSLEAELLETQAGDSRECEEPVCSQMLKSHDRYPSKGSNDPQNSNTIVLLKPGSTSMQNSADRISSCSSQQSIGHCVKPAYFPFKQMKRKLRDAMGVNKKERHWFSTDSMTTKSPYKFQSSKEDSEGTGREIVQGNSPNITDPDVRGLVKSSHDAKRGKKMSDANDFKSGNRHTAASTSESGHKGSISSIFGYPKGIESNLYLGYLKHLSNKLDRETDIFVRRRITDTLGRISSLPEYDFLPAFSAGRDREYDFVTSQMRFPPYRYYPKVYGKNRRLQKVKSNGCLSSPRENVGAPAQADNKKPGDQSQISDAKPSISENLFTDTNAHESISFLGDDSSLRGSAKMTNTVRSGEINPLKVPSESHCMPNISTNQSIDAANICRENEYLECSDLDSPLKNFTSMSAVDVYSSSPLRIQRLDDSNSMKYLTEQPSLVSFLEQICIEDTSSPKSIKPQTAHQSTQPHQLNVEEHHSTAFVRLPSSLKVSNGSASQYVKAVLQASGLSWDDLLVKCHSSDKLLPPSLFDGLEAWVPHQSCSDDHRLLLDYINEVLLEVYQHYIRCSPWLLFIEQKLQPVTLTNELVHKAIECLDWHLLSEQPSQTFEQLVEQDLVKSSRTWMDIRIDTEDFLADMVDFVLEELMTETAIELQS